MQRNEMCIHLWKRYNKEGEAFWRELLPEMNDGSTTSTQRAKFSQWSIGTKHLPVQGSSVILSARKTLLTIFWDMKGVVHMEFLKQRHTVNSEKCISTLTTLKARLRRVRSGRDSILQHDNARPHTSRQT